MRDLVATTFLTLDGVMQAPGGPEEDTSGGFRYGGWLVPYADEVMGQAIDETFERAQDFLLGRTTYQIFASYWPQVTDEQDPVASRLNKLPKHVASRTLSDTEWEGAELLQGDVVEQVRRLKAEDGGELQVHGSAGLLQTLLQNDLVDELRLIVFPVVLGEGKRLFGEGTPASAWQLRDCRPTTTGAVVMTYRRAGEVQTGTFALEDEPVS